ncbi:hypothetical protein T233_01178 [Vagococcus lutrae LBD1]|uniref:Type I restriction modification DNA specificity domain-containing protein n=1 Tax=Vagococcus lutrae LBD1 TaxID=1408226 RepID=V6Q558_9ENTE|nr:restriction endonuclease subunit S [Vagococcus lutrae]EST89785.1 hypothetical protein T233_01178 [Vagococcus lutrae LBD1]
MKTINKQPKIRFKGYTDEWQQRKLGEIAEIIMGQSPKGENYTENPDDHILVQGNADMKNGRVVPRVWTTQITKQANPEDIILSVRAPVGDVGKTDFNVVLGRGVAAIKGNEFIYQNLKKMKETGFWTRFSTGSTFESINSTDLKDALLLLPSNEEQIEIGNFFKQLDDTIALHQRKLEALEKTKKSFLQKMFPKKDETKPEIRFAGFTDDWEQRKLGEIIQVNSGKDYKHLKEGEIPVYGTGGYMLSVDEALSYKDAIGLGRKGTINNPYLLKAPFWTVDTLFYSVPINNNDLLFINTLFQNINWKKYDESTGVPSLSKNSIVKIEKKVPSIKEQEKIGLFFLKLSDNIALHHRQLEVLKNMKTSFLQKMYI